MRQNNDPRSARLWQLVFKRAQALDFSSPDFSSPDFSNCNEGWSVGHEGWAMGLLNFLRRGRHERAGFALYNQLVAAAREPALYRDLDVPDSLDGRFDMVGLYAALVIRRLRVLPEPGPSLAQSVFDAMFSDMDINLREMGVGDLSVGRKVREMWEAFHGRAGAYEPALAGADVAALAQALARNVWRGAAPPGAADRLARLALAQDAVLTTQDIASLGAGRVRFVSLADLAP